MPYVEVAGVKINFPFDPYPCQLSYMEKVIKCLQSSYNGLLESPTGTGKTLCLLCSSLAWLSDKKAQISNQRWRLSDDGNGNNGAAGVGSGTDLGYRQELTRQLDEAAGAWNGELGTPKIIYASRTHSQLTQAMQEMKRTTYNHFKACVIGSREQMCIHPSVMKETNNTTKVHLCRSKVSTRSCHFYNQVENAKGNFLNQILDIEDLVTLGQKNNCCPYYVSRELKKDADIIFMPYNYLLDPKTRKAHGIELQGNIVIFDEAHNLEKICEESASFDLSSSDIAAAISELNRLVEKIQEWQSMDATGSTDSDIQTVQDFTLEEVLQIKAQLLHLEEVVDKIQLPTDGLTKPGSYIFEIFDEIKLTFDNKTLVHNLLEKMTAYLTNDTSNSVFSSRGYGLSKFSDVVKIVFSHEPLDFSPISNHKKVVSKHYKVHIREDLVSNKKKKSDGWGAAASSSKSVRILSYWCFSPGYTMEELRSHGVKSIILTSGTLSPLSSFASELGIEFQMQLENPHVIQESQVWIGTVGKGPDGFLLSSAFDTRSKVEYQTSLGNAIVNFSRTVPRGLLIFFPSYPVMEKCLDCWQKSGIWNRIEQNKPMFVEPKNKFEFATAMENFYEKVNDPALSGAVFAAVCRGKVSEGLDFSDNNGRAVVITGLPYPPRMDAKVILKMKFLDEVRSQGGGGLTGQEWYRQQASRAVNQAIGRVIRHRHDYGAIILCDSRFAASKDQLPVWLRPAVKNYIQFGLVIRDLSQFFKMAEQMFPNPLPVKKKKKAGELGCHGAYFMLSESRKVALEGLEKASTVVDHSSSLKPKNIESDKYRQDTLQKQYSGISCLAGPSKPKTLLCALDRIENTEIVEDDEAPHGYGLSEKPTTEIPKQKKKIVIKANSVPGVTKVMLQTAEEYLAEVKQVLSTENYLQFRKILTDYKASSNVTVMVDSLKEIFANDGSNCVLLEKLSRFVRSNDREKYLQMCKKMIGSGIVGDDEKCLQNGAKRLKLCAMNGCGMFSDAQLSTQTTKSNADNSHMDSSRHLRTDHLSIGGHLKGLATSESSQSNSNS